MAYPAQTERGFSNSYDPLTKIITAAVFLLFIGISIASGTFMVGLLGLAVIGISYGLSPLSYVVTPEFICIKRIFGNAIIPLSSVREVRVAVPEDLKGSLRVFGNGGLFGYYGLFRTSALGICNWYITNRSKAVVLITAGKAVLVSPEDMTGFVDTVQSMAARYIRAEANAFPASKQKAARAGLLWSRVGALVATGVVALGAAAVLYAPGPPHYDLNSGGLTIHDRFYPVTIRSADIDVGRIRVVDIRADSYWRPVSRTNGFANSHYRSGWFRVAGGEKVRMYRAESNQLVLLPSKGATASVLMEVRQPEAFIHEVQRIW